jgi:RNA polymerase sigma-70 factor, ECF subfamily
MSTELQRVNSDEAALVARVKKGSEEAFNEIILLHQQQIFSLAVKLSGNQEDAEEIVQDVFACFYRKVACFEARCALRTWLYRITVNCALMKLRNRRRKKRGDALMLKSSTEPRTSKQSASGSSMLDNAIDYNSIDYADTSLSVEEKLMNRELLVIAREVINTLPEKFRFVLLLREVEGLSGEETALQLGLTVAAVKSRLCRAREMLKEKLSGLDLVLNQMGPLDSEH